MSGAQIPDPTDGLDLCDPGGLDPGDISLGDFCGTDAGTEFLNSSRELRAPRQRVVSPRHVRYENAVALARRVLLTDEAPRWDCVVGGGFIFGDFLEAWLTTRNVQATRMTINTLSLSQDNADSLASLMRTRHILRLDLIVSDYFFSHERRGLIPYLHERLGGQGHGRFRLAVCSTHMKTVTMTTAGGRRVAIHGSANLRSSGNIEQFTMEINPALCDFYDRTTDAVMERYEATGRSVRNSRLNDAAGIR